MTAIVQIKYNKGFAYIAMVALTGILIVINLIDVTDKRGVIFANVAFGLLAIYVFYKYFLPVLKGQIALELNDDGIYDFNRQQNTSWNNVTEIRKVSFSKGSFGLGILLADKKEFMKGKGFIKRLLYGYKNFSYYTPFVIPLQYSAGSDNEIIETVTNYLKQKQVCS